MDRIIYSSLNVSLHSSEVDFCEPNNDTVIVENFNTWSSLVISLYGLYGIYKLRRERTVTSEESFQKQKKLMFLNLITVGFCSAYFHATISGLGHFLDVYSIACILLSSIYFLNNILEKYNSKILLILMLITNFIVCLFLPSIELLLLFGKGYYIKILLEQCIKQLKYASTSYDTLLIKKITSCFSFTKYIFVTAFILWIIDFFLCKYLNGMHFHFVFHILIGHVAYSAINIGDMIRNIKKKIQYCV